MKRLVCGLALLLMSQPALGVKQTSSENVQILYLQQIDAAIREGRLTQAQLMIATLDQSDTGDFSDDFALLKAEYAIARMDVAAATVALSTIKDTERNICRLNTAEGWVSANDQAFEPAVLHLSVATQHCPDDAGAWNLLGLAFIGKNDAAAARNAFEHARALESDNAQLKNNYALALLQDGAVDVALRELDDAVRLSPQDTLIKANRNFVAGMAGLSPERAKDETTSEWSAKLLQFANGAKSASRGLQAKALFSRAMLTMERFDEAVWVELNPAGGRSE